MVTRFGLRTFGARAAGAALSVLLSAALSARAEEQWPDMSAPAPAVAGGERDAAVIVGVENYFAVPGVPGAEANAKAWYDYMTRTRGVPPSGVKLLLNNDAAREDMLGAAQKAAAKARPEGTLWFVFIGHGAPSGDGKDGLLVGVDAQQKAESLQTHSVKRGELLQALSLSRAGKIVVVLDACFSGRGSDGATIAPGLQPLVTVAAAGAVDPRMTVLTAAKGDQFAGPLPGAQRPAFSYLVLGALRGWAGKAKVTTEDLWRYASDALEATLRGRNQTPDLMGKEGTVVGASPGEKGPDLTSLAKATAGGGGFQVTNLPAVPAAEAPKALSSAAVGGLDFRSVDVGALQKYEKASQLDQSAAATPEDKAAAWRQLAKDAPRFADMAGKRASDWELFSARRKAAEEAEQKRVEARDADWSKLGKLLALTVVPETDKARWSAEFLRAYWKSPGVEPEMAKLLAPHAEPGELQSALTALGLGADKKLGTNFAAVEKTIKALGPRAMNRALFESGSAGTPELTPEQLSCAKAALKDLLVVKGVDGNPVVVQRVQVHGPNLKPGDYYEFASVGPEDTVSSIAQKLAREIRSGGLWKEMLLPEAGNRR